MTDHRPTGRHRRSAAHRLRPALSSLAAAALLAGTLAAHAQPAARDIDIPAQPLDKALGALARQTGARILFSTDLTERKPAPALKGSLTPQQALERLLAGSGLVVRVTTDGGFTVAPAPTESAGETTLPTVRVRAGREQEIATGPVQGYVARRSATATKTDATLLEVPQAVTVVGQAEIQARGAQSVNEVLRYTPGTLSEGYGQDDRGWEWIAIRGFSSNYDSSFLDGLKQLGSGYSQFHSEVYGLERVEVLRGPVSGLYGAADVGGIVNRVSKRPRADHVNELGLSLGSFAMAQVRADLGGALGEGGHAWRMVGLAQRNDPQADYPGFDERATRRLYLAPSLTLRLGEDTDMTLLGHYRDLKTTSNAIEYLGANQQRFPGVLAYEPGWDGHDQSQWALGYELEHRLGNDWKVRQHLRYSDMKVNAWEVWGYAVDNADADGNHSRDAHRTRQGNKVLALDNQLIGHWTSGGLTHSVLLGVDYLRQRFDSTHLQGPGPSLNIYRPVYGQPVTEPSQPAGWGNERFTLGQLGLYAQDQASWGNWRLSAGMRHDLARKESDDLVAGTNTRQRDGATTGRVGINYLFASGLAPYASWGSAFLPQAGSDRSAKAFDPELGRQIELGVKYQPSGGKGQLSAALYQLTKRNVLTPDPQDPIAQVQTGEIRSRGLELEARYEVLRGLNLVGNYTYNPVKVTQSHGDDLNKVPVNTPKQMASAWLDYTMQQGELAGLGMGLGIRHRGGSFADSANTVKNPAHTLLDAALWYRQRNWEARFNVSNLTNKDYASTYAYGYYWGPKRAASLDVSYRF